MSTAEAYCLFQDFEPGPPRRFQMPLHYLVYASAGRMRLECACRAYATPDQPLDDYGAILFRALQATSWRLAETPSPAVLPIAQSDVLARALELTVANFETPPSFEQLADLVGSTPRSLARRFSEELGMTFREYLRRSRIIRAIERLTDPDPIISIAQAAFEVGYSSVSAFNVAFREFTGITPSEYRASKSLSPHLESERPLAGGAVPPRDARGGRG